MSEEQQKLCDILEAIEISMLTMIQSIKDIRKMIEEA